MRSAYHHLLICGVFYDKASSPTATHKCSLVCASPRVHSGIGAAAQGKICNSHQIQDPALTGTIRVRLRGIHRSAQDDARRESKFHTWQKARISVGIRAFLYYFLQKKYRVLTLFSSSKTEMVFTIRFWELGGALPLPSCIFYRNERYRRSRGFPLSSR